jgi:SM-20-related protein
VEPAHRAPLEALDSPAPHKLIRNFLGEKTVRHLLQFAEAHQDEFRESTVGNYETFRTDKLQRVSLSLSKIGDFKPEIVAKTQDILPNVFVGLGCPPFEPAGFEIEMVAHGHGAFFTQHIDTFVKATTVPTHRVISMVYYFHALPKAFSGGILRLHSIAASGREGTYVDIEPVSDTAVFFLAWFPHEVSPVACPSLGLMDSRFAINCWVHKKNRKTAPSAAEDGNV